MTAADAPSGAATIAPDLQEAARFINALTGSANTLMTFQILPEGGGARAGKRRGQELQGTLDHTTSDLVAANETGSGIFVCINDTGGRKRLAENIEAARAIFMDWDEGNPLDLIATLRPIPHIVVESSPGKAHAYWLVSDCALADFKPTQQAIAARNGADPAVCDLPRIMRMPGFVHRKGAPFLTHIVSTHDVPPYTLAEIKAGLLDAEAASESAATKPKRARAALHGAIAPDAAAELARVKEALLTLPPETWDDRDEWRTNGMALHALGTDSGMLPECYAAWCEASKVSSKFDEADSARVWNSFSDKEGGGVTVATIFAKAKRYGYAIKALSGATDTTTAQEDLTEIGNSRRFTRQHGENARWVFEFRKWLLWDGQRWLFSDAGEEVQCAKATARSIYAEAAKAGDLKSADAIAKHARSSQTWRALQATLALAQSEPGIALSQSALDAGPMLLSVSNGVVDLTTGMLRAPSRLDYVTKRAHVEYDEQATCPRWREFLRGIFGGDEALIAYVQRAVGYSLTGSTAEQCLFFLYGTGRNGKSTFLGTLKALMGDYAAQCAADSLMVKPGGGGGSGANSDIARLRGARMVSAIEAEDNKRMAESLIKQMTGGDTVVARFLYQENFEFVPQFKLWLAANHKPVIRGTDLAIWRRIHLVPFTVTIPESKVDKLLPEKLAAESAGVLNWALEGCAEWLRLGGLNPPAAVTGATAAYREEMDVFGAWLQDCCNIEPKLHCGAKELYASYREWCESEGSYPLSSVKFSGRLLERRFIRERVKVGQIYYGLALA